MHAINNILRQIEKKPETKHVYYSWNSSYFFFFHLQENFLLKPPVLWVFSEVPFNSKLAQWILRSEKFRLEFDSICNVSFMNTIILWNTFCKYYPFQYNNLFFQYDTGHL
jgi:hypothetical protein